jgi:hypothetical protein
MKFGGSSTDPPIRSSCRVMCIGSRSYLSGIDCIKTLYTGVRNGACSRGMQLVETRPIILGGDPTDPQNKTWVTRQQHFEMVRYWNRMISDLHKQGQLH